MKCPFCGAEDTRVIDSRPADDNAAIRRRRKCEICGKRFTTYEKLETMPMMVIKKDQSRVPYDRSKIEKGIIASCHKRPISTDKIKEMVDEIENEIFMSGETEIPSTKIGELVMDKLREVDQVAYVRFASVYREFKDVKTFMAELTKLVENQNRSLGEEEGSAEVQG
jgi:transcriptional repressor NrdR